jgi:FlaA1/EpsC-like NDP-sugar epimerase
MSFNDEVFYKLLDAEGRFDIVANFAAHKHVRSEKDIFSIEAMLYNNVINAYTLLKYLTNTAPSPYFCVSTDKAANPVNIMGASKKLMEDVLLSFSDKIKITTARFANVAFSNGSLPAGFFERIAKRQPISCPHDVKRYFISPMESGQLCMLACILGMSSDIFFPKLDIENDLKPFTDILYSLFGSLGLTPQLCTSEQEARQAAKNLNSTSSGYPVYLFKSDTTGEKEIEEFYTDKELINIEKYQSLGFIYNQPRKTSEEIEQVIHALKNTFKQKNYSKKEIVKVLKNYVSEFDHLETGLTLDNKM